MTAQSTELVHATSVAIGGRAILIQGPSGCGKSDLALRLIDRGAMLISDDYTDVRLEGPHLTAWAPERIAGQIEVRGLGISRLPNLSGVRVALVIVSDQNPPRMPLEPQWRQIAGGRLPLIALNLLEASAPIKVEMAVGESTDWVSQ